MSTGLVSIIQRKSPSLGRFADLAKLGEVVFHADDLANLWQITNKNTLYTTLKRYTHQGLLFRIQKGLYALKPPHDIDPYLLGVKVIHGPAYVSTETVLADQGLIQQSLPVITLISHTTKRFSVAGIEYYSRRLPAAFLYQPQGIQTAPTGVRIATTERALADLRYFNSRAYFDAGQFIDWQKVRALEQAIGYPSTPPK